MDTDEGEITSQSSNDYSLKTYFKSINRYRLLSAEEEKDLAIRIKETEGRVKDLVMRFDRFFKRDYINIFPALLKREIRKRIKGSNGSFQIFDELISLEKARKHINHTQRQSTHTPRRQKELEAELYAVESSISKMIARTNLTEQAIKTFTGNLGELSNGFKKTVTQEKVEWN